MYIERVCIRNFRRLQDVSIDLQADNTIVVGANNSGKTSATHLISSLVRNGGADLTTHDFSSSCWPIFNKLDADASESTVTMPAIELDIWLRINGDDLGRVIDLIPALDWEPDRVGVRLSFAAKSPVDTLRRYRHAREAKGEHSADSYRPWPQDMLAYLEKNLQVEFALSYFKLDPKRYESSESVKTLDLPCLGDSINAAKRILGSLITVDTIGAQRYLSDADTRQSQHLSTRLSRFYSRNLEQYETSPDALKALSDSEVRFNDHLATVFKSTLNHLAELGYPGLDNPDLVIKSKFSAHNIMSQHTSVHYALPKSSMDLDVEDVWLPEKYNGLGFKNLIYMVIEVLDAHTAWMSQVENRSAVHILFIEEPEVHLHTQLQQVFINKIREVVSEKEHQFSTQLVVTTHSPHIINESRFTPVKYFRRERTASGAAKTTVLNLSDLEADTDATRKFLIKYMELTHCDLFFADALILVEGAVEKLLMPLMIDMVAPSLKSNYLSVLAVGGAHAHKFRSLVDFLRIPTLVITDLDSVGFKSESNKNDMHEVLEEAGSLVTDSPGAGRRVACRADQPNAVTSNQTLIQWHPQTKEISKLCELSATQKVLTTGSDPVSKMRIAYQTTCTTSLNGVEKKLTGRTFEEAFAFENLQWVLDHEQLGLGLNPYSNLDELPDITTIADAIFSKVREDAFRKTDFAIELMMSSLGWRVPTYIQDGLAWLDCVLNPSTNTTSGNIDVGVQVFGDVA